MLKIFALLFILFSFSCQTQAPSKSPLETTQLRLFDELSILFPDDLTKGEPLQSMDLYSNSTFGFYLLVDVVDDLNNNGDFSAAKPQPIELSVRPSLMASAIRSAQFYQVKEIPVEVNTGRTYRTEKIDGIRNPYVVRRAPFKIYEAFLPLSSEKEAPLSANALQFTLKREQQGRCLYYFQFKTGRFFQKEQAQFKISLKTPSNQFDVEFPLNLFPLEADSNFQMDYICWHNSRNYFDLWGDEPFSDEWFNDLSKTARLMKEGKMTTFSLPWYVMFEKNDENPLCPIFQPERTQRYIEVFAKEGISQISAGRLANRKNGLWAAPHLVVRGQYDVDSVEGETLIQNALTQLNDFIESRGDRSHWYFSISDEPLTVHAEDYCYLADKVRTYLPNVPILEATKATDAIVGAVDVWCPTIDQFQKNRAFFEERKKQGDTVWVYTCLEPGGRWLNRLLDQERLRQVWFGWAGSLMDVSGYLHWGFDWYQNGVDPWKQSVVSFFGAGGPRLVTNQLPAGDSHIVYPNPNEKGQVGGARYRAMTIGMEDYQLLEMLRKKNLTRCDEIIQKVVSDYQNYSTEIFEYREAKHQLLEALVTN